MGLCEGFFYGFLGGVLSEIFGLFRLRHATGTDVPTFIRSFWYWAITIAMTLAGGILVVVYLRSGIDLKAIVALNIGASAPLIISTLTAQVPRITSVD